MKIFTIIAIIIKNIELALRDLFGLKLRPYKVLLELTDFCNSKCETCYIWKNSNDQIKSQIDPANLESVLKEYGANLIWVALGGGEVTLYQRFDELIEILGRHCPNLKIVTFTTNGLRPDKALAFAKKIKKNNYDLFVTISLDGDEKTHDNIRGMPGNYLLAQQTMQLLKGAQIWTHFGLTVSSLNSSYIATSLKSHIKQIRAFSFEHSGGIYKTDSKNNAASISESIKQIKSLYKITQLSEVIEYLYIIFAQKFFESNKTDVPIPCEVIATSLHIRPNGDIKPCMYLPSIGNIKNSQIGQLLNSAETKLLRKKALSAQCEKCWMNCYAPHSIMRHPLLAIRRLF